MKKPKNYYCHRGSKQDSTVLGLNKYQIVEKIGQGSFGEVYKVFDPSTSSLAVLKKIKNANLLTEEARVLSQLTQSEGFDRLKTNNTLSQMDLMIQNEQKNQNTIIMGCLGPNTGTIMQKIKKMNIYSLKKIAYQIIKKLKQIHNRFYVHRDIKPDNILFGNKYDSHSVYLIDFGLTTNYKKNSTKARKVMQGLVGTAKYCPIASHYGLEQYPKDDLESLGYVLLYYVTGSLPWDKVNSEKDQQLFQIIKKKKCESSIQQLCANINCLRKYWTHVKSLNIDQKINYNDLLALFDVKDQNRENCFQFCEDCWIRSGLKQDQSIQIQVGNQPKPNKVRPSLLN